MGSPSTTDGDGVPGRIMGTSGRPAIVARVRHFTGSSLTGPLPTAVGIATAADALRVSVELRAARGRVESLLEPLSALARLVSSTREGRPIRHSIDLGRGARGGRVTDVDAFWTLVSDEAGAVVVVDDLAGALPTGVTAAFDFRSLQPSSSDASPVSLTVEVFRSAGEGELAVSLTLDRVVDETHRTETVVIPGVAVGAPLALLVPSPFDDTSSHATLAVVLAVVPAPAPGASGALVHANSVRACRTDLVSSALEAKRRARRLSPGDVLRRELESTLALLAADDEGSRRSALLRLADATGAPLFGQLALTVDAACVGVLAAAVRGAVDVADDAFDRAALAWLVEAAAVRWVVERAKATLVPTGNS